MDNVIQLPSTQPGLTGEAYDVLELIKAGFDGRDNLIVGLSNNRLRVIKGNIPLNKKIYSKYKNEVEITLHNNIVICSFFQRIVKTMNITSSGIIPHKCKTITFKKPNTVEEMYDFRSKIIDQALTHLNGDISQTNHKTIIQRLLAA